MGAEKPVLVLDTNVIISAAFGDRSCQEILAQLLTGEVEVITDDKALGELSRITEAFKRHGGFDYTLAATAFNYLVNVGEPERVKEYHELKDRSDETFLRLRDTWGDADLVTQDHHLLNLRKCGKDTDTERILRPEEWLALVNEVGK